MRFLLSSAAFYSHDRDTDKFCLEDGFKYFEINDCEVQFRVNIASSAEIDSFCCIQFKRNLNGGLSIDVKLCSFRQNLEACVLEIKQTQKQLHDRCKYLTSTLSPDDIATYAPNIKDIEKELKKDDDYLAGLIGISFSDDQALKVCNENEKVGKNSSFIENYLKYKEKLRMSKSK